MMKSVIAAIAFAALFLANSVYAQQNHQPWFRGDHVVIGGWCFGQEALDRFLPIVIRDNDEGYLQATADPDLDCMSVRTNGPDVAVLVEAISIDQTITRADGKTFHIWRVRAVQYNVELFTWEYLGPEI